MKKNLQILSDLHFEFYTNKLEIDKFIKKLINVDTDIIIIAGDLCLGKDVIYYLNNIRSQTKKEIIFVPGNHEYYGSQKCYIDNMLKTSTNLHPDVHILIENYIEIHDIIFIGSTGWWDKYPTNYQLESINDFKMIYDIKENNWGVDWGIKSLNFFNYTLDKFKNSKQKIVCISHNGVVNKVHKDFENNPLNSLFINNWEWVIEKYPIDLWIYGHSHKSMNFHIQPIIEYGKEMEFNKSLNFITNPFGYFPFGINKEFEYQKIIKI